MALSQPYRRICRPFKDGNYVRSVRKTYLRDSRYASDATNYVRAYRLLENHLLSTFDYVEPSDDNLSTYSHQLYQLLLRACTEFEANAKAILRANGYSKAANLNTTDYFKIERACRLSEYIITIPVWNGKTNQLQPFKQWQSSHSLTWYQSYNDVKHNRSANFSQANLGNALNAVSSVLIILFAQFNILAFDPYHIVGMHSNEDGRLSHESCFLHVELPKGWTEAECYDFDWEQLKGQEDPFQRYPF
jgi:hypothetical protein